MCYANKFILYLYGNIGLLDIHTKEYVYTSLQGSQKKFASLQQVKRSEQCEVQRKHMVYLVKSCIKVISYAVT